MYFLSHLLLSGALAAAPDADEMVPPARSMDDTLTMSMAPAESIKTVFVTVTRTLYPATSYPIPSYPPLTTKVSSHFAIPSEALGENPYSTKHPEDFLAGPIYQYTSLTPARMRTEGFPKYSGDAYVSKPPFTFNDPSMSIPFEGHYTPMTRTGERSHCELRSTATVLETLLTTLRPDSTPTSSDVGYVPSSVQPDETMDILPLPTPTKIDFDILPIPDSEETLGILPLPAEEPAHALPLAPTAPGSSSAPAESSARRTHPAQVPGASSNSSTGGFNWPTASPSITVDKGDDSKSVGTEGLDDETAWSGTDNAIAGQMHDPPLEARTLPWLSPPPPPPLQSSSAAVRRIQRFWDGIFGRRDAVGADSDSTHDRIEKHGTGETEEKKECKPCANEGKVLYYGDSAIGYCRGGCEELQFLGRGPGSGCASNATAGAQVEVLIAVAMVAALLYFRFAF